MDKKTAIDKIHKCLALAKSSTEHEAATALRQAQALMREYGVSHPEVLAAGVVQKAALASGNLKPTIYETSLASAVARSFGCDLVFSAGWRPGVGHVGSWVMIGHEPGPDVASYSLDVLYTQLQRARKAYSKATLKRYGKKNKIAKADAFCEGWVNQVRLLVPPMVRTDDQDAEVEAYKGIHYPQLGSLQPRERKVSRKTDTSDDYASALAAGRSAQLHRGLGRSGAPALLEG